MALLEPGGFIEAAEQIKGLDGLAAGTLYEIVDGTCHNQPAGSAVESPSEIKAVGLGHVFGVRQHPIGQQANKGFLIIRLSEAGCETLGQDLFFLGRFEILRGRQILPLIPSALRVLGLATKKAEMDVSGIQNAIWGKYEA